MCCSIGRGLEEGESGSQLCALFRLALAKARFRRRQALWVKWQRPISDDMQYLELGCDATGLRLS